MKTWIVLPVLALTLLTGAKTQQQFEAYEGCTSKAEKARFYIRESRAGR